MVKPALLLAVMILAAASVAKSQTAVPLPPANDAPTLRPVYLAYCEAVRKRDEKAIKQLYSSETLKAFYRDMRVEHVKTLLEFLEDEKYDKICEIKNEELHGDWAIAVVYGDSYPKGLYMIFAKQNGRWKLTNRSPLLRRVSPR